MSCSISPRALSGLMGRGGDMWVGCMWRFMWYVCRYVCLDADSSTPALTFGSGEFCISQNVCMRFPPPPPPALFCFFDLSLSRILLSCSSLSVSPSCRLSPSSFAHQLLSHTLLVGRTVCGILYRPYLAPGFRIMRYACMYMAARRPVV